MRVSGKQFARFKQADLLNAIVRDELVKLRASRVGENVGVRLKVARCGDSRFNGEAQEANLNDATGAPVLLSALDHFVSPGSPSTLCGGMSRIIGTSCRNASTFTARMKIIA